VTLWRQAGYTLLFNHCLENNYLRIRLTDILQPFHRMKAFWVQMINLHLFFDISSDDAMATNFVEKMANLPHSSLWHSEMEWYIAASMCTKA